MTTMNDDLSFLSTPSPSFWPWSWSSLPPAVSPGGRCRFAGPSPDAWAYAVSVHGACVVLGGLPVAVLLHRWRSGGDHPSPWGCRCVGLAAAAAVLHLRPVLEGLARSTRAATAPEISWFGPFVASTCGFSTCLKAFSAASGDFPPGAARDPATWIHWCTMLPEPVLGGGDGKKGGGGPRMATAAEIRARIAAVAGKILVMAGLLTVLLPAAGPRYDLVVVPRSSPWWAVLLADHANGFVHIWFLYGFASFCLDVSSLIDTCLTGGLAMEDGFRNPLLGSRSYREVWGTRWNRTVHLLLKRAVYKPARSAGLGPVPAAVLTFLGSGVLHEYSFRVHNHAAIAAGVYVPGSVTLFFLGMGLLMVGESWVWNRLLPEEPVRRVLRGLPAPVAATLLCLSVSGPAERYFLRSWTASGLVESTARMIPHFDCR